jgi:2,4-dienoyl-CoA reductase-like NADH-dependent reductase (Old Yellow Enzyme family)
LVDGVNQRRDEYGGSVENRTRSLYEVSQALIAAWSADHVGVRLLPDGDARGYTDYPALEEAVIPAFGT